MVIRYITLTSLLLFSILSQYFIHDSVQTFEPTHYVVDDTASVDLKIIDFEKNKKKLLFFFEALAIFIIIVLTIFKSTGQRAQGTRRLFFLKPIFYQSNYVDTPLLNQN